MVYLHFELYSLNQIVDKVGEAFRRETVVFVEQTVNCKAGSNDRVNDSGRVTEVLAMCVGSEQRPMERGIVPHDQDLKVALNMFVQD